MTFQNPTTESPDESGQAGIAPDADNPVDDAVYDFDAVDEDRRSLFLTQVSLSRFRSFRSLENLKLTRINVIVGANGAGKSNFVDFFKMYGDVARKLRPRQIDDPAKAPQNGAAPAIDFYDEQFARFRGKDGQGEMSVRFTTNDSEIHIALPGPDGAEGVFYAKHKELETKLRTMPGGKHRIESNVQPGTDPLPLLNRIPEIMSSWTVYHFHNIKNTLMDDSGNAECEDGLLKENGSNIGGFLRYTKRVDQDEEGSRYYKNILGTVRTVAPFLEDFVLDESAGPDRHWSGLHWKQKKNDSIFHPWHFSDGTLRFICLMAVFLQPNPPPIIIIDEPELGLHPEALDTLKWAIEIASRQSQIIITTQSTRLLDCFKPADVIVADRKDGASYFWRPKPERMDKWLEDMSLGELWDCGWFDGGVVGYE